MVVTDKSAIDELISISGKVQKENILQESILQLAHLWNPAIQNGYIVCAYVKLHLQFFGGKITVDVL
ncbi:MAG: hypothetical protein JST21_12085 [Bacteroidetes bacterium]|nr:hypothetical protein [Bacteroidota bacterium]